MNKLVEQMEKDQTEVIDKTSNIKSLADEVKKLRAMEDLIKTMEEASKWFVDMDDLNQKAGEFIARITGAEAGLVTAGAASGMVLQAAACIAGSDPYKINQLPNTTGMKNEIILHYEN